LAVRIRDARRPRLATARREHRHRCDRRALGRFRRGRAVLRAGRRAVRLREGIDFAGNDPRRALDRRPGHGAARRRADAGRADRRQRRVHVAAGLGESGDRLLACAARPGDPRARAGLSAGHRRRRAGRLGPDPLAPGRDASAGAPVSPLLKVDGLRKAFGGVQAVEGVSFELAAGELLAMIGPNGAGKSTCFNMINGQLAPDAGSVALAGREIAGRRPRDIWRLGVGRTFQVAATYASMTVAENVQMALLSHHGQLRRFWPRAASLHRDEALALLAAVGLRDRADEPCSTLAYGDIKTVELAIAL